MKQIVSASENNKRASLSTLVTNGRNTPFPFTEKFRFFKGETKSKSESKHEQTNYQSVSISSSSRAFHFLVSSEPLHT